MILNVSGRTDIVGFYIDWFMNRMNEGFVDVRNPFNPKLVSRIYFKDVDLIVFCTKNPISIVDKLEKINKPIIFHVTLTPYNRDFEPNVPDKKKIIDAIKKISKIIGKENLYIRYDPIIINCKYDLHYHIKAFTKICNLLDGYVEKIIVSFVDYYKNIERNWNVLNIRNLSDHDYKFIGKSFSEVAKKHNIKVQTCSEKFDLTQYGFVKGECLSKELAYKLTGKNFKKWTARKNKYCECVEMVDIGVYNTCKHFCKYCYANFNEKNVLDNINKHNPMSSLLIGELQKDDIIKIRK